MKGTSRLARSLALGLVLAVLALLVWALGDPPAAVDTVGIAARALAAQVEVERDESRARETQLAQRVTDLEAALASVEAALASEQELRFAREREWLEFTQVVGSLGLESAPPIPEFLAPSAATDPHALSGTGAARAGPSGEDPAAAEAARVAAANLALDVRGRAMRMSLGALLTAEQVQSLDFRELGRPHNYQGRGVVGPVFARLVDDRGHYIGGLYAERMWLEVSRAARCVTLILEDGYETRGGVRQPFEPESRSLPAAPDSDSGAAPSEGAESDEVLSSAVAGGLETRPEPRGVQRIFLSSVDPAPWLEALPEIIDQASSSAPIDDGVYDRVALKLALNELLRKAGTEAGEGWRFHALGGVQSGVLRDVQLVEHAADGGVVRRLFADRLEVHRSGRAIELVLEQGSQERSGRRAPFLEGRYRVVLPRARADDWVAAGVPGAARTR